MFQGINKTQPVDIRLIDFQLSKLASPILDLSYYLYLCADDVVLENFDFLLQAYYSSLSDSLEEFGVAVENIITFKELKEQWKTYGQFGLAMCPFILKIVLCEADEVVDFTEVAKVGGFKDAFNFKIKNHDLYETRVLNVFEHWENNFL